MPLIDYDTRQAWDELYNSGAEWRWGHPNTRPEVRVHMCRGIFWPVAAARYASYYIALGVLPSHTLVVVGAGYGYSVEYLVNIHGYNAVAVDTSAYIQTTKDASDETEIVEWMTDAGLTSDNPRWQEILDAYASNGTRLNDGDGRRCRTVVLNEDSSTNASRNRIRGHFGLRGNQNVDYVISEGLVESFNDSEIVQASDWLHQYANNVAHTFIPLHEADPTVHDPRLNFKTLAQWRALLPNDIWINGQTGEITRP